MLKLTGANPISAPLVGLTLEKEHVFFLRFTQPSSDDLSRIDKIGETQSL
jgi:hypothetical protein